MTLGYFYRCRRLFIKESQKQSRIMSSNRNINSSTLIVGKKRNKIVSSKQMKRDNFKTPNQSDAIQELVTKSGEFVSGFLKGLKIKKKKWIRRPLTRVDPSQQAPLSQSLRVADVILHFEFLLVFSPFFIFHLLKLVDLFNSFVINHALYPYIIPYPIYNVLNRKEKIKFSKITLLFF